MPATCCCAACLASARPSSGSSGRQRREICPPAGAPTFSRPGGRLPDDQSGNGRLVRVRPVGVGRSDPPRRDQSHPCGRARSSKACRIEPTVGKMTYELPAFSFGSHQNPVDWAGHVSAVGGGDRPLRRHDQHRTAARGRGKLAKLDFKRVRLNALMSRSIIGCAPPSTSTSFCTIGSANTSSASSPPPGPIIPTPTR